MSVSWTLQLHCKSCSADITYDTQVPKILTDRSRVLQNNKARRWVNSEDAKKDHPEQMPFNVTAHRSEWIVIEFSTKYTLCPVCEERIYFEAQE